MAKYQRLYNANKLAHSLSPHRDTVIVDENTGLKYDPLTKSILAKPIFDKTKEPQLLLFFQERKARLLKQLQDFGPGSMNDIKEMQQYMTEKELQDAFNDLEKYKSSEDNLHNILHKRNATM